MCPNNRNECSLKIEINTLLETHEQISGKSWAIFSMVDPRFSGVTVVLSSDEVNTIFFTNLMIFIKGLPRDLCYELEFINTGLY